MHRNFFSPRALVLVVTLFAFCASAANAQTTVWNTPSTDILALDRTYVEADFVVHIAPYDKGGFQTYGTRLVYGARKRMEIGVNAFYSRAGDTPQPVEVQPNAKWQIYQNEDKGIQASVGGILYLPVTHRTDTDTFGMVYSNVSKKIQASYGPRITGGFYALLGRNQGFGTRMGAHAGYEQPLHSKVIFVADWITGKSRFGTAGGALVFTTSKKSVLQFGYNVGNQGRGNNSAAVIYGYTF